MNRILTQYYPFLTKPSSIAPLVIFRIIIGAMMAFSTIRFMALGWIEKHYIQPKFHFKYYGFEWVKVAPEWAIYFIHFAMILAAIGIIIGLFYRLSAFTLFILFTYTELIDLSYYLNHYYFVSIVCALLVIVPANKKFSLDVYWKLTKPQDFVPRWSILIFQLQLGIVYFYAGIAKINSTWLLEALPLKIWLPAHDKMPVIGNVFTWKITPHLFSWFGMLYDCFIPFFLSYRKTRIWAYFTVIIFHSITGFLFQIGVFPLVMIGATLIFFSEKWHNQLLNLMLRYRKKGEVLLIDNITFNNRKNKFIIILLTIYFTFQILFPFRYIFYSNNLFWSEEGYRFSWRVMLMEKSGSATFYVKDKKTSKEGTVFNNDFLNLHQEKQMAMQPDMILQYAHFLAHYYQEKGMEEPLVRAEVYVTLNGKPSQLLIDPNINLTQLKDTWQPKKWVLPYPYINNEK